MWVGLIQSVESLTRTKTDFLRKRRGILPAKCLWTWTTVSTLPESPAYPSTLQILCFPASTTAWVNPLKSIHPSFSLHICTCIHTHICKGEHTFTCFLFELIFWGIVTLQCCFSFCSAAKWISYIHLYPFFFGFHSNLSHHRELSRVPSAVQ